MKIAAQQLYVLVLTLTIIVSCHAVIESTEEGDMSLHSGFDVNAYGSE